MDRAGAPATGSTGCPTAASLLWRTTGALTWVVAEGHGRALGWLVACWWRLLRSRPPGPPRQAERPGLELVDF